ncbi:sensor histidine kinase [Paenibacillus sp. LMG 31456]|uniref:histidine kinase n=1 Tax=Paenibacillus foliorum TaxID=2654974 RepID=A0A972GUQ3_9BACL|nr:histidine kinase [Paenibacillus foliorum]NOU96515.1 sensor histidine kinase [Paenibacillus foliorum]
MSLGKLKLLTILLPPLIIGGFEYIRHDFLLEHLSMEAGNYYITLITLLLSYLFASWMFRSIVRSNEKLAAEQARRAVYVERERLAQELHDNIAQILFFLNVQLKKGELQEARSAVSEIDEQLRQAIFNLRTSPEEGTDLPIRLASWLDEWCKITGIAVERKIEFPANLVPLSAEVQIFAMIREAFTNIRKHSQADHAYIELRMENERSGWTLEIRDNGVGLGRGEQADANRHGLSLMRKHASQLNAAMTVETLAQGGTAIRISGPKIGGAMNWK